MPFNVFVINFSNLASNKWWSQDKELVTSFLILQNHWLYTVKLWSIITAAVTLTIVRCNGYTSPKFDFWIHPAADMLSVCEREQDPWPWGNAKSNVHPNGQVPSQVLQYIQGGLSMYFQQHFPSPGNASGCWETAYPMFAGIRVFNVWRRHKC